MDVAEELSRSKERGRRRSQTAKATFLNFLWGAAALSFGPGILRAACGGSFEKQAQKQGIKFEAPPRNRRNDGAMADT
jgi:hypothetical protein